MVGLCLGPVRAASAAGEQSERLLYVIQFGGLSIADVMITMTETPERYQTTATLRTRGLMKLLGKMNADVAGEGRVTKTALGVEPELYRSGFSMEKFDSSTDISYEPTTKLATAQRRAFDPITGEERKPEDTPWNKRRVQAKPVPEDKRMGVLDPMAAFISARQAIRESAGAPTTFRVPVYDGLRRYDIVGTTEAAKDVTISNVQRKLIGMKARMVPVFGFDDSGLRDRVDEGDGKILFSADDRVVPVQIMMGNSAGVAVMNLVADCRVDPAPCDSFGLNQAQAQAPKN